MNERDAFDRILASLHEAMLDDAHWLPTSALIDDACRTKGNMLTFAEGQTHDDVEIFYIRFCFRGEHHKELEREYFTHYFPWDERIPRLRQLPDSQLFHVPDLYTEQELKTSPAYNEVLPVGGIQNGLNVRLEGPSGSRIVWNICDPVGTDDWSSDQLDMIRRLLPHIRQFVRVRQALADAGAAGTSLAKLLDNNRFGIIQLARSGHIEAVNDPARDLLRKGDGLCDRGGFLHARSPAAADGPAKPVGTRPAARRRPGYERFDVGNASIRLAAARLARQPRGRRTHGLPPPTCRRARADRRPCKPGAYRS